MDYDKNTGESNYNSQLVSTDNRQDGLKSSQLYSNESEIRNRSSIANENVYNETTVPLNKAPGGAISFVCKNVHYLYIFLALTTLCGFYYIDTTRDKPEQTNMGKARGYQELAHNEASVGGMFRLLFDTTIRYKTAYDSASKIATVLMRDLGIINAVNETVSRSLREDDISGCYDMFGHSCGGIYSETVNLVDFSAINNLQALASLNSSIEVMKRSQPEASSVDAKFLSLLNQCVNDTKEAVWDKNASHEKFKIRLQKMGGLPVNEKWKYPNGDLTDMLLELSKKGINPFFQPIFKKRDQGMHLELSFDTIQNRIMSTLFQYKSVLLVMQKLIVGKLVDKNIYVRSLIVLMKATARMTPALVHNNAKKIMVQIKLSDLKMDRIDVPRLIKGLYKGDISTVTVDKEMVVALSTVIADMPKEELASYMLFRYTLANLDFLSENFRFLFMKSKFTISSSLTRRGILQPDFGIFRYPICMQAMNERSLYHQFIQKMYVDTEKDEKATQKVSKVAQKMLKWVVEFVSECAGEVCNTKLATKLADSIKNIKIKVGNQNIYDSSGIAAMRQLYEGMGSDDTLDLFSRLEKEREYMVKKSIEIQDYWETDAMSSEIHYDPFSHSIEIPQGAVNKMMTSNTSGIIELSTMYEIAVAISDPLYRSIRANKDIKGHPLNDLMEKMACILGQSDVLLKSENIIIRDSAEAYIEQFNIDELHRHLALYLSTNIFTEKKLLITAEQHKDFFRYIVQGHCQSMREFSLYERGSPEQRTNLLMSMNKLFREVFHCRDIKQMDGECDPLM